MNWLQQALGATMQKQAQRDQMRALLQAANTPVSDEEIATRFQQEFDSSAFPLDTPQGQVINPQLAALIAEGMKLQGQEQLDPNDPLAGIPIGIEGPPPTGPSPNFPQNGGFLQNLSNTFGGIDPIGGLRNVFSQLNDVMVASTGQRPATAQAAPVQLPQAAPMQEAPMETPNLQGAMPEDIASFLGTMQQEAAPLQNDVSAIAAALSPTQAAPEEKGWWSKLGDILADPYIQEVMLQTGSGLSQSQPFGQALTTGVEKGRARQAELASLPLKQRQQEMAFRKFETDLKKTDAETGKLTAETKKLMKELDSGSDALGENDYGKLFTDMQKHVSSDIFRMAEDSPFKLDSETYARYLTNSGLRPESRRYGPLKAEYGDLMSSVWGDVRTGKVKQSVLDSRIDEFEVAFGPQQTARLLLKLQGK